MRPAPSHLHLVEYESATEDSRDGRGLMIAITLCFAVWLAVAVLIYGLAVLA